MGEVIDVMIGRRTDLNSDETVQLPHLTHNTSLNKPNTSSEHKKKVIEEVVEKMEQWEGTMNAYREERMMLRVGPEEMEREAKRVRVEDVKEVMNAHTCREEVKKAEYAGSAPDIDMSEVATTDMVNTTPVTSK
jgi:hypothetical protein